MLKPQDWGTPAQVSKSRKEAAGAPTFSTYINQVRQVMDVVLEHGRVGGLQSQQVLVPGFDGLQLILCVLGLALKREQSTILLFFFF